MLFCKDPRNMLKRNKCPTPPWCEETWRDGPVPRLQAGMTQHCPALSLLSQSPHLSPTKLPSTPQRALAEGPSLHKDVPKSHTEWYKTFKFPSKTQFLADLCSFVLAPILNFSLNNYSPSLVFASMINFHYTAVTAPLSLHFSRLIKASSSSLLSQNDLSFPTAISTSLICPPSSSDLFESIVQS